MTCRSKWSLGTTMLLLAMLAGEATQAAILSQKRGFADTGAGYSNLQATGAGWYYTWGLGAGNPGNFDAKHYPMFWGGWAVNQTNINNVKAANPEYVLGFNEPERSDQANMTVSQAISSWTTLHNGFAGTGIKLVSPAVSDTSGGQAWLSSFMSQANSQGLRVDAVAFHWYGVSNPDNPAGAASSFLSRVDSYYNSYGKPVFITEFAIHDWGNAYSDAAIIEANRQFLDIVIPALDSRSYVAGYAWYHWFSDARLYNGNPPVPTPMSYAYTGVLKSGQSENIAGRTLGEHVAYLAGGTLQQNGAVPGVVRYINALEGTSTVTGTSNWNMTTDNWIRIQPGATLRKSGANAMGILGGSVTNNGLFEIAEGTFQLGSSMTGSGNVLVSGGTLALTGRGQMSTAPRIEIKSAGTFDVSLQSSPFTVSPGQTLHMRRSSQALGSLAAGNGSQITGAASVSGDLSLLAGSVVRIGDDGSGAPRRVKIDDFESYALGNVRDVASPPWTAHENTSLIDIESYGGGKVLTYGWATNFRGGSRTLPEEAILENSESATYFFRFNSKTDVPNHNLGLGDKATTATADFGDYEAQLRIKQGTSAGTVAIDARNGGGFSATLASGLALNAWYNVWMVVDQATDTYDVYMNQGDGDATAGNKLNASPLAFRNGTSDDLNVFLALAGSAPVDNGVRVDDLFYFKGLDLTNPLTGYDPEHTWFADVLAVGGNYSQATGSVLEINLFDPASYDVLSIAGHAALGGELRVTMAYGAPAPQAGDVFQVLEFDSASGAFDLLTLPALDPGLAWKTSDLALTGELQVVPVVPGDFNHDGVVDGVDFLAWQRGESPMAGSSEDLASWQANFGAGGQPGAAAAVPEPSTLALVALAALAALASGRGRHAR
ncbi:MAG: hypothetical protein KF688_07705 [Pirellulales bacterium]|nr:hypothetical protein [Pirellulales bacterium]